MARVITARGVKNAIRFLGSDRAQVIIDRVVKGFRESKFSEELIPIIVWDVLVDNAQDEGIKNRRETNV